MITFSKIQSHPGSNVYHVNIDRNGEPLGVIRKFKNNKTDTSPWQVILLDGTYENFWGNKAQGLKAAKKFVKSLKHR